MATLRKGARGSARGGGLASRASHVDKDRVIRATDNDASTSRVSAVEAGYLEDPFAKYLCAENWQRRLPLMNRGECFAFTRAARPGSDRGASADGNAWFDVYEIMIALPWLLTN